MTILQIESNIKELIKSFSKKTFLYDFLLAYGLPKSSITRLQKGTLNLSQNENELIWKKKLFFREVYNEDLHLTITKMLETSKYNERFIIATDYSTFLAIDTKTNDRLDIDLKDLPKHYDFFLPWAGIEKAYHQDENPADVKAAIKMAKLFDEIRKDNPSNSPDFLHHLNVFLSRLLFCFFAEDTNIFDEGQFINSIDSHTLEDGSDLNNYFDRLFEVLNTPKDKRKSLPEYFNVFPYVNGGLFRDKIASPKFKKSSRRAILDSGDQDWSAINPDIFGSMFQAVVSEEQRTNLGQHYTSVPNIMKVIKPLFLDELNEAFKKNENNPQKLIDLLNRLGKIKIFDPACGSGNFLIIAYKELRKLEIKIIQQLLALQKQVGSFDPKREQLSFIPKSQMSLASSFQVDLFSRIQLNNFYGIEMDDFAHEISKLSLWLAEHQMNTEFLAVFGKSNPTLPLKEAGNIVCANACRIDWEKVCPKLKDDEIYILGNPPYLGFNVQNNSQRKDLSDIYPYPHDLKYLDYIVCWFIKAGNYIDENSSFAFVSTNSICQGSQAPKVWPYVLKEENEIFFTYPEFIWSNNAKKKAGVICSIIGVRKKINKLKYIYENNTRIIANNINFYLSDTSNITIDRRQHPISSIPPMFTGNIPYDGGNLIINEAEKNEMVRNHPEASQFIKQLSGSYEFINNSLRYCIWIDEENKEFAKTIPPIRDRILLVKESRLKGGKIARNYAHVPYRFYMIKRAKKSQIIIPRVSSIRREYIPIGFLGDEIIVPDSAQVIYDPESYVFSILNSKMHMVWVRTTAGRLKSDYRYSAILCYNTFPFPNISDQRKNELTQTTFRILEEREKYPDKTLAELYDPDKMPDGLREAHHLNDLAVERCYRSKPFESDEERLEYLFRLYEQMIEGEKERDTLFAKEKKPRKRKK